VPTNDYRIILDTNILLRAFINLDSSSGRLVDACQRRAVVPLLSGPLLGEYRFILNDPDLVARFPQLLRPDIAVALERLAYVSDLYPRPVAHFDYARDPKDSKLIELAIVGQGTHLITTDKDLLTLPTGRDEAAKRFRQRLPHIEVVKPDAFVREHGQEIGIKDPDSGRHQRSHVGG
jgi:putative PIN family toxin of toxin-antitoxin system